MTIYASIMTVIHPVYHYLSDGNEPKLCPKQQSNVVRPFEIDNKGPQYQVRARKVPIWPTVSAVLLHSSHQYARRTPGFSHGGSLIGGSKKAIRVQILPTI